MDPQYLREIDRKLDEVVTHQKLIHQVLVGYNGKGDGLLDMVKDLNDRVKTLERRGWLVEAARVLVAGFAGLFGGRLSGN